MARIMAVDNDSDTLTLIKSALEKRGHEVITVSSGKDCIEKAKKKKHDLVLVNIMMPDMSGWDIYQKIKKIDEKIKVAFLSIIEVSSKRRKALLRGSIADFITKPFLSNDFARRVDRIVK